MFEKHGLKLSDVTLININFSLSPALLAGRVDAVIVGCDRVAENGDVASRDEYTLTGPGRIGTRFRCRKNRNADRIGISGPNCSSRTSRAASGRCSSKTTPRAVLRSIARCVMWLGR